MSGQPPQRTIVGGSRAYVSAMAAALGPAVRAGTAVQCVRRDAAGVDVELADGARSRHDAVVLATHADQALALLAEPDPAERDLLGRFRYSANDTVLHGDVRFMLEAPYAHASSELRHRRLRRRGLAGLSVTYDLNRLQGHRCRPALLCSLNPRLPIEGTFTRGCPTRIRSGWSAVSAQAGLAERGGQRHTWFCGAHLLSVPRRWRCLRRARRQGLGVPCATRCARR
ncbi:MAG: FAD-dependent oxidoreductase [Vicinamibacterales bacterium]